MAGNAQGGGRFRSLFKQKRQDAEGGRRGTHSRWSMGVLNDPETIQVPGSVLLLASSKNEPLGLRQAPARTSHSSIPTGFFDDSNTSSGQQATAEEEEKKKTKDGKIILEPQPDDSANDPLNWPAWRRDTALLSLGFYCMVGGGITPLLAAGFYDVADDYSVSVEDVSLTTGLYMMGMGLGSVIASPTAILWGKRPVYLFSAILFIGSSIWCALSPSFGSLVAARVFQGMAISPVECLPSATIAEIFFLHERAYRIGIYTLLLLGGKNLVPLISAAVIQSLGWRWVFWIVSFVVAFGLVMLFLFVPETFWDRSPQPKVHRPSRRPSFLRRLSSRHGHREAEPQGDDNVQSAENEGTEKPAHDATDDREQTEKSHDHTHKDLHVGFADSEPLDTLPAEGVSSASVKANANKDTDTDTISAVVDRRPPPATQDDNANLSDAHQPDSSRQTSLSNFDSLKQAPRSDDAKSASSMTDSSGHVRPKAYTHHLRQQPPKSFSQQLKVWNGRLNHDKWFKVMLRPFVLLAYPAVLWSTAIYSCSIGWLIVISNTMSMIYRSPDTYNFNAFQTGLVYISPFVGGILGTAVAGKISDVVVKALARRNGGLYEPEFRLVMAAPIMITTVIGLMGFGWSAEEKNHYMVPTVFFGIVSFGCSLGSTTSITFCVDSYRQYAGEALVTLNFCKNVLHGLVFSLFVTHWMASAGAKSMYMWLGVIQLILCLFSVPMYIYGKRARMWTVRKNLLEKF